MRLVLTGRHVDITPALRTLVDRKLARLRRVLGHTLVSTQVVLTREKSRHAVEMTVHMRGDNMLNARALGQAWPAVLASAVEKVEQQARKVKGKWDERKRRAAGASRRQAAPAVEPVEAPTAGPRVVRVGRGQVKPMSVENAAIELDARDEPYLIFRNVETDALSVLVRRRGKAFGLIEPEV
jgi:putative sigma-54 modulation protein